MAISKKIKITRSERYKKYENEIEPRIRKLVKSKLFIEAFLLISAAFENEVADLVEITERYIQYSVSHNGHPHKLHLAKIRRKRMTLGEWIPYLEAYGFSEDLTKKIKDFISLRNECIHRLLEGDVRSLDKRISESIIPLERLCTRIVKEGTDIIDQEIELRKKEVRRIKYKLKMRHKK
jgi:hypothetical protein